MLSCQPKLAPQTCDVQLKLGLQLGGLTDHVFVELARILLSPILVVCQGSHKIRSNLLVGDQQFNITRTRSHAVENLQATREADVVLLVGLVVLTLMLHNGEIDVTILLVAKLLDIALELRS